MTQQTQPQPGGSSMYPNVIRAVLEAPWAILPSTLAAILDMLAIRAGGERLSDEEIQARIGAGPVRRDLTMAGNVAVIPIYGVITPRADMFSQISGGTSVQRLQGSLRDAVDSKDVKSIVLDVDSPGGQVDLVPELAAELRSARQRKPVVAVANTTAASAAYWLGAQASEFVVTPSGNVGSIGVFAAHDDISAMQEKLGVKTSLVSAGKYKTEGNPFEPLTDDAREAIQKRVDDAYALFTADVAKGRRVPVDSVREGFGEGRMATAKDALKLGMVDSIDTLDATVQRLQDGRSRVAVPEPEPPPEPTEALDQEAALSGLSFAQTWAEEASALHDSATALLTRTRSLAEYRDRSHLTVAKRDRLAACTEALRDTVTAFQAVLDATRPGKQTDELVRERMRFERSRLMEA